MRALAFAAALFLAGCCCHPPPAAPAPPPEQTIPTVKLDENGCWFDGCNTCCRTGASGDPLGIGAGITCTLVACVKTLPGEK